MAFQLAWNIEGEQQLLRNLRGVKETMGDWKPAFDKTARDLKRVFANDVFSSKGRAVEENWPPLKPQYLAQKRAQGFSDQPLVKTGKMQKSFKSLVKADSATIWNAVTYFRYHQSNKPRTVLPRRVMMKLGNDQKAMVVKIFHTHFVNKLKRT
jgi:phage gpG-like protein